MVFSSLIFLFAFLPLALIGHILCGQKTRNLFLLIASLMFYTWGEGVYVLTMFYCIASSFLFGLVIDKLNTSRLKKTILWFAILANLLPLLYFKYTAFLLGNINLLLGDSQISVPQNIVLPIGISFFTFQAISYLVDVYRNTNQAQKSLVDLGLYIALFPQLIAGPIVRYNDIADQLRNRVSSYSTFSSGVERFIIGLGKKVLIANPLGLMADVLFWLPTGELNFAMAWLGVICYAFQIYFDFSGYSDMAIGLGRMLGFKFQENFNYPYISKSIREFWRRWHISLSTWFRDYVYIPLGGSHGGNIKTARNLLIVFVLCGFWHGASWNFLIWGIIHGAFLILERGSLGRSLIRCPAILQHIYTLVIVMVAWVFFRSETLSQSVEYVSVMFQPFSAFEIHPRVALKFDMQFVSAFFIAAFISTPLLQKTKGIAKFIPTIKTTTQLTVLQNTARTVFLFSVLILSVFEISTNAYNPFIYFRF